MRKNFGERKYFKMIQIFLTEKGEYFQLLIWRLQKKIPPPGKKNYKTEKKYFEVRGEPINEC